VHQEVTAFRRRFDPWCWKTFGCNIGSSGGNTAIQLGKTAMNADTSDAVLTLVININEDDAPRTTAATLAGS
jgi:hypothetical protein